MEAQNATTNTTAAEFRKTLKDKDEAYLNGMLDQYQGYLDNNGGGCKKELMEKITAIQAELYTR